MRGARGFAGAGGGPSQVGRGQFERVLEMTKEVRDMGMEVCATLGMLTPEQAVKLKDAGLTAYNHNLDTSPEYYDKVTSSRKYEDRLNTIAAVRGWNLGVLRRNPRFGRGGVGSGESDDGVGDASRTSESVPITRWCPSAGRRSRA